MTTTDEVFATLGREANADPEIKWAEDDDAPVGLAVMENLLHETIGWKRITIRGYIRSKEKRDRWLLDILFYRVGTTVLSSRRRYREWSKAIAEKYSQMTMVVDDAGKEVSPGGDE